MRGGAGYKWRVAGLASRARRFALALLNEFKYIVLVIGYVRETAKHDYR